MKYKCGKQIVYAKMVRNVKKYACGGLAFALWIRKLRSCQSIVIFA